MEHYSSIYDCKLEHLLLMIPNRLEDSHFLIVVIIKANLLIMIYKVLGGLHYLVEKNIKVYGKMEYYSNAGE
jgi:hypothetical protein